MLGGSFRLWRDLPLATNSRPTRSLYNSPFPQAMLCRWFAAGSVVYFDEMLAGRYPVRGRDDPAGRLYIDGLQTVA